MPSALAQDCRFALRLLGRTPLFTAVAVLCIALGAGAVTTIFSAMNAVVLRPLPGAADPGRLVDIERRSQDGSERAQASYSLYEQMRDGSKTMADVAAWSKVDLSIGIDGHGHAVYGNIVSGNFFRVLGVKPALGRFFLPQEDRTPLTHPVVVVAHSFWKRQLGADPNAIGKAVTVNGHPFTIVGVAPPGFRGAFTPLDVQAWVPLMMQAQLRPGRDLTTAVWLWTFGRLKPGASVESARQELGAIISNYAATRVDSYGAYTSATLSPMTGLPVDAKAAFLGFAAIFFGAALFVLLIASVNVAAMLSARGIARRREMAVRAALGAGRGRLVRQLLTEVLLLFLFGGAGAVAFAAVATSALERLPIPGDTPLLLEISPDMRVLVFALLLALVTGLVFGLGPALRAARVDIVARLRSESAGGGTRRTLMSNALIVGQLALSLLLLVAAALFVRALDFGARVNPGFDQSGVATTSLNTESWGYDEAKGRAFYRELRDAVSRLPGVSAVSYTGRIPLTMSGSGDTIAVDNAPGGRAPIQLASVDTGYFAVLRIPLLQGRGFTRQDDDTGPRVAVVNETFARRFWPDGSALGRTFGFRDARVTIVGIARDAKYSDLSESTPAFAYFPLAQMWQRDQALLVRAAGEPHLAASGIERAVLDIDPLLPRPTVIPLTEATGIVLLPQRAAAWVTGGLGIVGLLLAAVGLYGIMAYSSARRTREMAVRMALGAQRADVLGIVVKEGMRLAGLGVAIGVLLAAGATRVIAGLLFGVSPLDPLAFIVMSAVFAVVALVACYLPARRAAAGDLAEVLRAE
jgi:predicted permease